MTCDEIYMRGNSSIGCSQAILRSSAAEPAQPATPGRAPSLPTTTSPTVPATPRGPASPPAVPAAVAQPAGAPASPVAHETIPHRVAPTRRGVLAIEDRQVTGRVLPGQHRHWMPVHERPVGGGSG